MTLRQSYGGRWSRASWGPGRSRLGPGGRVLCVAAMCAAVFAGCQTPQQAFDRIELGKPLDPAVLPLFAKQTKNGASHEGAWAWILPLCGGFDVLHVLKDDAGLVVAKSYYHVEGVHWGLTASMAQGYVLEAEIPKEYCSAAPEAWDGARLFKSAFPQNWASVRKSLARRLVVGAADEPGENELKAPAELPKSYTDAQDQLWRQMQAAASQDEQDPIPPPGKNVATRLMMTFMMLETLAPGRPQRQAQDISNLLWTWPPVVPDLFSWLGSWNLASQPWQRAVDRPPDDQGQGKGLVKIKHLGDRRVRVEYDFADTASVFAKAPAPE